MTERSGAPRPAASSGLDHDWRARLKRVFVVPLMVIEIGVGVAGAVMGALGPPLAAAGLVVLFGSIAAKRWRRVSAAPALVLSLIGVGVGVLEGPGPALLAMVAFALLLLYVVWYSRNGRTPSPALSVGSVLPELTLRDLDGGVVSSRDWRGRATILLFYRGNWCPLCSLQVRELAERYREIEARGARVVLVSPQRAEDSRALATGHDAPMTFLVDEGNAAARRLGIQHPGGAPLGVAPEGETVLPTAVVLDADGVVRFADETDNYRFRPDPAEFIAVLDGLERQP